MIAVTGDYATIFDGKTGKPRHSDIIQVMLYMSFLPYSPLYKRTLPDKILKGCVAYKSGERKNIPPEAINDDFRENVTYFLDILESPNPPKRTPSPLECSFCDITSEDCPERIGLNQIESGEADLIKEPEILF